MRCILTGSFFFFAKDMKIHVFCVPFLVHRLEYDMSVRTKRSTADGEAFLIDFLGLAIVVGSLQPLKFGTKNP